MNLISKILICDGFAKSKIIKKDKEKDIWTKI